MTAEDVAAIVEGLAPVILELVAKAHADLQGQHAAHVVDATKALGSMGERVAVLETRAQVPGPPGDPGKDGEDGLGYDDLTVEQLDATTVTVKAVRGGHTKVIGTLTFPVPRFDGNYTPGLSYTPGQLVRWKSAVYHCYAPTALAPDAVTYDASGKPAGPQGKDAWHLILSERRR
jgi:hypothetical protein